MTASSRQKATSPHPAVKALPLAALLMLGLLPVRGISLIGHLDRHSAHAGGDSSRFREADALDGDRPAIALRDGVMATPVITATLSAGSRMAPVGEDRPADGKLLAEVARRQAELDRRQHDLDGRAGQVQAAETLARQQIAELTKLRTEIEGLVVHETGAAGADLDMLVGLYQNMKPVQAAAVLGKMEPQRAGLILQHLGDRNGGPILAAMDPGAALAITDDIAQRRSAFRK